MFTTVQYCVRILTALQWLLLLPEAIGVLCVLRIRELRLCVAHLLS